VITVNGRAVVGENHGTPVVGIDPSSDHIGIAHLDGTGECTRLVSIRCLDNLQRTCQERLYDELARIPSGADVYIEKPPPTARAHVNHGHQGTIGYALGVVTGIILGDLWRRGFGVGLVEVGPWRDAMLVAAGRRGLHLSKKPSPFAPPVALRGPVKVENTPGHGAGTGKAPSFDLVYACGHRRTVGAFAEVQRARGADLGCEACAKTARSDDVADPTRDHWKANACRFAQLVTPTLYDELVADARGRAKTVQPDHRLAGVADACEGLGVAVYGHAQSRIDF